MCEIIETIPWHCGERDCQVGWHKSDYWVQEDGSYTVDTDGDGDHEEINADDLPSGDECAKAWSKYCRDCIEKGDDHLHEFASVKYHFVKQQKWQAEFRNSIAGAVLIGYRRNGRGPWISPRSDDKPPKELVDYLCLVGSNNCLSFRAEWLVEEGSKIKVAPHALQELQELAEKDEMVQVHMPRSRRINGCLRTRALLLTVKVDVNIPNPNIKRDVKRAARERMKLCNSFSIQ